MKNTTNVFLKGMTSDMHPLTTSQLEYTDALNATLITFNGNEQMMQNDMGNTKIQDTKTGNIMGLREGFIPVGMKEHGGIMYIASVNKKGEGEIGTIPSPVIKYKPQDNHYGEIINFDWAKKLDSKQFAVFNEDVINPEEIFVINIKDDNTNTFKNMISSLTDRNLYIPHLIAITSKGEKDITPTSALLGLDGNYWLQFDKENFSTIDLLSVNLPMEDSENLKYVSFYSYPKIQPGKLALKFTKENIDSFSLAPNGNINQKGKSKKYPVLEYDEDSEGRTYYSTLYGVQYISKSQVRVDWMTIHWEIENGESGDIKCNKLSYPNFTTIKECNVIDDENDNIVDNDGEIKTLTHNRFSTSGSIQWPTSDRKINSNDYYLCRIPLGNSFDKWITLKITYYKYGWDNPLNSYTIKYNPYYMDVLDLFVVNKYWAPNEFVLDEQSFTSVPQYRDYTENDSIGTINVCNIDSDKFRFEYENLDLNSLQQTFDNIRLTNTNDWPSVEDSDLTLVYYSGVIKGLDPEIELYIPDLEDLETTCKTAHEDNDFTTWIEGIESYIDPFQGNTQISSNGGGVQVNNTETTPYNNEKWLKYYAYYLIYKLYESSDPLPNPPNPISLDPAKGIYKGKSNPQSIPGLTNFNNNTFQFDIQTIKLDQTLSLMTSYLRLNVLFLETGLPLSKIISTIPISLTDDIRIDHPFWHGGAAGTGWYKRHRIGEEMDLDGILYPAVTIKYKASGKARFENGYEINLVSEEEEMSERVPVSIAGGPNDSGIFLRGTWLYLSEWRDLLIDFNHNLSVTLTPSISENYIELLENLTSIELNFKITDILTESLQYYAGYGGITRSITVSIDPPKLNLISNPVTTLFKVPYKSNSSVYPLINAYVTIMDGGTEVETPAHIYTENKELRWVPLCIDTYNRLKFNYNILKKSVSPGEPHGSFHLNGLEDYFGILDLDFSGIELDDFYYILVNNDNNIVQIDDISINKNEILLMDYQRYRLNAANIKSSIKSDTNKDVFRSIGVYILNIDKSKLTGFTQDKIKLTNDIQYNGIPFKYYLTQSVCCYSESPDIDAQIDKLIKGPRSIYENSNMKYKYDPVPIYGYQELYKNIYEYSTDRFGYYTNDIGNELSIPKEINLKDKEGINLLFRISPKYSGPVFIGDFNNLSPIINPNASDHIDTETEYHEF